MTWGLRLLVLTIVVMMLLIAFCGCVTFGRWLAPIQPEELTKECRTQLAAKDAVINDLRREKPSSLWLAYLIGAAAVPGGAVLAWLLSRPLGIGVSLSGLGLIGALRFMERYSWALFIPFGILVLAGAYLAYDWIQGLRAARKVLGVVVDGIETYAPGPGPVKAAIEKTAAEANLSGAVKSVVSSIKARLKH